MLRWTISIIGSGGMEGYDMRSRIAFGVIGFAFVLCALFILPPIVLEIALVLLCGLAAWEITVPTGLVRDRDVAVLCTLIAVGFGWNATNGMHTSAYREICALGLLLIAVVGLFAVLLRRHDTMHFHQIACGLFGSVLLPYLLLALMRIFQMEKGRYLVLLPLLAAWGSDTFAYFAGRFFGKHKLAPVISPKKTIEGAVGGVLGGSVCVLIFTVILDLTLGFALPYWAAAVLGAIGAAIGQIGDLSFSVIKRQTGIKDYGHIFPGHGGVLDRFDSVIFVAPVVELVLRAVGVS